MADSATTNDGFEPSLATCRLAKNLRIVSTLSSRSNDKLFRPDFRARQPPGILHQPMRSHDRFFGAGSVSQDLGQELLCPGPAFATKKFFLGAILLDPARVHEDDPVGHPPGEPHLV